MRLTILEQKIIKEKSKLIFGNKAEIYLFGSRADDKQKGGDIDLYIQPNKDNIADQNNLYQKRASLIVALQLELGMQKIDIIIAQDKNRLIEQEALKNGIKL